MTDFFISYSSGDRKWAEWIAWVLEEAGYSVVIQAWDFCPGSNFASEINQAVVDCERIIPVLSPRYLDSEFAISEMLSFYSRDPLGARRLVMPVRVETVEATGLLRNIVYVDFVDKAEEVARRELLDGATQLRAKPARHPRYPTAEEPTERSIRVYPGRLPTFWNIVSRRNPDFTGRETGLEQIHEALASGVHVAALTQAISGLGGIGKTQIALEYAYRYSADYDLIWWIRSADSTTLASDYVGLADALNFPKTESRESSDVIGEVRRWLGRNKRWLLIFDDVAEPQDLQDYLPLGATGHVLVTSRHRNWQGIAKGVALDVWTEIEATAFIFKTTGRDEAEAAKRLAKELGYLPLSLAQAGAYIRETGCSFEEYLELFRNRRTALWRDEDSPPFYDRTVATTWDITMATVRKHAPESQDVMNLLSFLAPDNIPRTLITHETQRYPREVVADPIVLNRALKYLGRYSMIQVHPGAYSVHGMVQAVTRDRLPENEQSKWAEVAVRTVAQVFPPDVLLLYDVVLSPCQVVIPEVIPHALAATQHTSKRNIALGATWLVLNFAGLYLHSRSESTDAERAYRRALEICEGQLGRNDAQVAKVLHNLAWFHKDVGRYSEAEKEFRRALSILEVEEGSETRDVARIMIGLATVLQDQGKYGEAERLLRQALDTSNRQKRVRHRDVAFAADSLAQVLNYQGEYAAAEIYFRQALEEYAKETNTDSLSSLVAENLNDLGCCLRNQGRFAEAELVHRRVLAMNQSQRGEDNPHVALSLGNLGLVLQDQGRYSEAEELLQRALKLKERWLGSEHAAVAEVLNDLAVVAFGQGRFSEGESYCRRALEINEKQLGPEHPHVAANLNNLAEMLREQGMGLDAMSLCRRALRIREDQLGADHPDVGISASSLAVLLCSFGEFSAAEPLLRRALEIFETKLGGSHPRTQIARANLMTVRKEVVNLGV